MLNKRENNETIVTKDYEVKTDSYGFEYKVSKLYNNKQKILITSTRGISHRDRHLQLDLLNLIPHSKKESKIEKHIQPSDLVKLAEINYCNNLIYFENHDLTGLNLVICKLKEGPSIKFKVGNIHTSQELKLTGNCLKNSRPILSFDKSFDEAEHLKTAKYLLTDIFNTPYNHPKSKPFIDHVFNFAFCDGKIWFRNYQIFKDDENKEDFKLIEIGPRFSLEIFKIFKGVYTGDILYKNETIKNVTELKKDKREELEKKISMKAKKNLKKKLKKESKFENLLTTEEKLFE